MINTVRIASCFEGEQERTLPILETVYQDGERLRDPKIRKQSQWQSQLQ